MQYMSFSFQLTNNVEAIALWQWKMFDCWTLSKKLKFNNINPIVIELNTTFKQPILIQLLSNLSKIMGNQKTADIIYYLRDADVISFLACKGKKIQTIDKYS